MNKEIDNGGMAFPSSNYDIAMRGMTLRDWFAGMAMQSIVSRQPQPPVINRRVISGDCYDIADAMIESRKHNDPYGPCVAKIETLDGK
jgi:hypothetical protein